MKKIVMTLLLFCLLLTNGQNLSFAEGEAYWHGYKGDGRHSGFVDRKMSNKMALQWRYFFKGDFLFPVQIFGDDIYFLDRTGAINSIKKLDATENYQVRVKVDESKKQTDEENRFVLGIDVCDQFVFVTLGPLFTRKKMDLTCYLVALDRTTGKKVWQVKYDCLIATPPVVFSNRVYVATGKLDSTFTRTAGGNLYSYDISTQEEILNVSLEDFAFYGEPLTYSENILITHVIKYDERADVQIQPKMVAFDSTTGKELWSEAPMDQDRIFGLPSVKDGALYVMENPFFIFGGGKKQTPDAWLLKYDLKTGRLLKNMVIKEENFGNFSPTLAQDAIYINSFTGSIYSIDYEMDRIYWKKQYDRFSYFTELTATRNYLYTCLFNGEFLCISKEDGSVVYRYRIGNYGGIPVISGDEVYVSGECLFCFSVNAKPLLILEPSSLDFEKIKQGESKQKSFRVLYTGIEKLEGKLTSTVPWLSVKPANLNGNIQTCFATIDTTLMEAGNQEGSIIVETNFGTKTIPIKIEVIIPPPLPLSWNIKEGHITNQKNFILIGQTDPLTRILINSLEIFSDDQGRFSQVILLKEGTNVINVEALSKDSRSSSLSGKITLDTIPPLLEVTVKRDEKNPFNCQITGKTEPGLLVLIGDEEYKTEKDGSFSLVREIDLDIKEIVITVEDLAGNRTKIKKEVL
jgi:outer membrane protein assembly factor BamB